MLQRHLLLCAALSSRCAHRQECQVLGPPIHCRGPPRVFGQDRPRRAHLMGHLRLRSPPQEALWTIKPLLYFGILLAYVLCQPPKARLIPSVLLPASGWVHVPCGGLAGGMGVVGVHDLERSGARRTREGPQNMGDDGEGKASIHQPMHPTGVTGEADENLIVMEDQGGCVKMPTAFTNRNGW